jgi:hypothetical protein
MQLAHAPAPPVGPAPPVVPAPPVEHAPPVAPAAALGPQRQPFRLALMPPSRA